LGLAVFTGAVSHRRQKKLFLINRLAKQTKACRVQPTVFSDNRQAFFSNPQFY
jgi:hypothetical protein